MGRLQIEGCTLRPAIVFQLRNYFGNFPILPFFAHNHSFVDISNWMNREATILSLQQITIMGSKHFSGPNLNKTRVKSL